MGVKELNKNEQQSGSPLLAGFIELSAAILSLENFRHFNPHQQADGIICLSHGELTVIIVSNEIWQSSSAIKPYLEERQDTIIICAGTEQELNDRPQEPKTSRIFDIALPISVAQLEANVQCYFTLQGKYLFSESYRHLVQETNDSIKYVLRVSRELNGIRDTNKLLNLILMKAREISQADAGSIYVVEWDQGSKSKGTIHFKITQNETVELNLQEFQIPINESSIVGNSVLLRQSINIPDLYKLDPDRNKNPHNAQYDKGWDRKIGYECRSMLTLPMFDISAQVIGVIQLINRKKSGVDNLKDGNFEHQVERFPEETIEYAEIIAHQAGIALENALLTEERENLFEGFVHASVTAIEQRDPTTSGHSHRVAKLTTETARLVSRVDTGPYANTHFTDDQIKEIEFASLLHDFGKLGVRENVLVKAKKLYPMEQELIMERFDHIRSRYELEYAHEVIEYLQNPHKFPPGMGLGVLKGNRDKKLEQLDEYLEFVIKSNEPTVLEQGGFEKLKDIANISYQTNGPPRFLLKDSELKALSVSRGSLTREEFAEIQSHVTHTYEFLRKIPWGNTFQNVPQIAAKHHEKLDGSGYPTSAVGNEIPTQSRIMTIADIFDALTASDRPYKKAVPTPKALDIIEMEVKSGKLDLELFKIFIESKIYQCVLDEKDL